MTTYNKKLAIAIPTYNRPEILEENLLLMLPDLRLYSIPVYISDDSSDLKTEAVIKRLQSKYGHIYYRHNQPSFGHDGNFFATLAMPDTDYVWYMGDSLYFKQGVISEILEALDGKVDFCFVNYRVKDTVSRHIDSVHDFLVERTWYLTLSGATIYGRKPRSLLIADERKKEWRNFVQLGLILEYCSRNVASMYWHGKQGFGFNRKKKTSYWTANTFSVFVEDWCNLIRSFQVLFSKVEIVEVIKSHAVNAELFTLRHLIFLRANNGLNSNLLNKYRSDFSVASQVGFDFAYFISFLPKMFSRILWKSSVVYMWVKLKLFTAPNIR